MEVKQTIVVRKDLNMRKVFFIRRQHLWNNRPYHRRNERMDEWKIC